MPFISDLAQDYKKNWKPFEQDKKLYLTLTFWVIIALALGVCTVNFLTAAEIRQTTSINDPIFNLFNPIDLSWPIFFLMYFTVIYGIILVGSHPQHFLLGVQALSLTLALRILSIFLTPLSPPEKMIFLIDPFTRFIFGEAPVATKDLFFSGHTCTAHLIYLMVPSKKDKMLFATLTILIALGLFLQQVHYTIDLMMAPFVSYFCYHFTRKFHLKDESV